MSAPTILPASETSMEMLCETMLDAFSDYAIPLQLSTKQFADMMCQRGLDLASSRIALVEGQVAAIWLTAIRDNRAYLISSQMTSIRALEKAHLFDPETHLDRWLFRMAHNLWLNELRARRVRQGGGLVPVEDVDLPDTSSSTEVNILAREVFSFIEQLPEAQRVTVLLVYVEGFRYAEAAEVLELPIGTVMSRLAAARKRLTTLAGEQKEKGT